MRALVNEEQLFSGLGQKAKGDSVYRDILWPALGALFT
jgi:hypothetical protein